MKGKRGRLIYIEPNALPAEGVEFGNNKDNITWDPSDLTYSVDLYVVVPEVTDMMRYGQYAFEVNSNTEALSPKYATFFAGDLKGTDSEGREVNYLTDNYTDIPFTNTSFRTVGSDGVAKSSREQLGIDSIDITFNAQFFPVVTMHFTDVRAASLIGTAEEDYYNNNGKVRSGAYTNFYRALFHFPYPKFMLTVKGFYGTKVTFQLSVNEFKTSFDNGSGSFKVDVSFIGYMYGLYTDIPMQYLIAAPYIGMDGKDSDGNETLETNDYWERAKAEGRFTYAGTNGGTGSPMLTFVEYMQRYLNVGDRMEFLNLNQYDTVKSITQLQERRTALNGVKTMFDDLIKEFKEHYKSNKHTTKHLLGLSMNEKMSEDVSPKIKAFGKALADYNEKYKDTKLNTNERFNCNGDGDLIYPAVNKFFESATNISMDGLIGDEWNNIKGDCGNDSREIEELGGWLCGTVKKGWSSDNGTTINSGLTVTELRIVGFDDELRSALENIEASIENNIRGNEDEMSRFTTEILGFAPTIENIFRMIFAHLETFMNKFEKCVAEVRNNGRTVASTIGFGGDDVTDITTEGVLPPFFGLYKRNLDDNNYSEATLPTAVNREMGNGNETPEVNFTYDLCDALLGCSNKVHKDVEDYYEAEKRYAENRKSAKNTDDDEWAEGSFTGDFIPLSYSDLFRKENPYRSYYEDTKKFSDSSDATLKAGFIMYMFFLRDITRINVSKYGGNFTSLKDNEINNEVENFYAAYPSLPSEIVKALSRASIENLKHSIKEGKNLIYTKYERDSNVYPMIYESIWKNGEENPEYFKKYNKHFITLNETASAKVSDSIGREIERFDYRVKYCKNNKANAFYYYEGDYNTGRYVYKENHNGTEDKINNIQLDGVTTYKDVIEMLLNDSSKCTYPHVLWPDDKENLQLEYYDEYKCLNNIKYKALLFLYSISPGRYYTNVNTEIDWSYNIKRYPECELLYYGGLSWLKSHEYKGDSKFIKSVESVADSIHFKGMIFDMEEKRFEEWAENTYADFDGKGLHLKEGGLRAEVEAEIKRLFVTTKTAIYIQSIAQGTGEAKQYEQRQKKAETFAKLLYQKYFSNAENSNATVEESGSAVTANRNIATSVYYNLSNLYSKWLISFAPNDFTLRSPSDALKVRMERFMKGNSPSEKHEFDNFLFVDSYQNDISRKFFVNPETLFLQINDLMRGEAGGRSVFEFMNDIAEKNKLLFLSLPVYNTWMEKNGFADMFRPHPDSEVNRQGIGNTYVLMYTHEMSKFLDDRGETGVRYKNDGIDLGGTWDDPRPTETANFDTSNDSNSVDISVPMFGVTYGMQNQSYFKNITVNMDNPKTTDYSIMNTLQIAESGAHGSVNFPKGTSNDLFSIYSNRSYTCTVEMMGCMNIMPLMYFNLSNIPMFKGAYMIVNVEHHIKSGDVITKFTGVRVSKRQMPYNRTGFSMLPLLERAGERGWLSTEVHRNAVTINDGTNSRTIVRIPTSSGEINVDNDKHLLVPEPAPTGRKFDVSKALTKMAESKPKVKGGEYGYCSRAVRGFVNAALDTNYESFSNGAYCYKQLAPLGFEKITGNNDLLTLEQRTEWTKNNAQTGDIALMEHYNKEKNTSYGHVCMFDGVRKRWISDFEQENMWVYKDGEPKGDIFIMRFTGDRTNRPKSEFGTTA